MKTQLTLRLFSTILMLGIFFNAKAQSDVYASYITDSSSDFQNANRITDNNHNNYGYLSNLLTLLSSSYIRVGFGSSGSAGDEINIVVQGTGEILGAGLLNNITIRLYDSLGANVANGTGSSLLELYLLSSGTHTYAIRFHTNPTDNYRFKEVRVEFNNILAVSLLSRFRVYSVYYQQPCPAILATSVFSYSSFGLLTGYTENPGNAVDVAANNYATLVQPLNLLSLLPDAYLDVSFSQYGRAGDYVGFTVAQGSAALSAGLLSNINIAAYSSSGALIGSKNGFVLLDLKLLSGTTDRYMLGFVTNTGSFDIARIRITLNGVLNLAEDLNLYNAFHFRMNSAPVTITSSTGNITPAGSLAICNGGNVTLTAGDPSGGTQYHWSTGATTSSIIVSTSGVYSVQVSDGYSCTRYSIPVTVTIIPTLHPHITGDTALCPGTTGTLQTAATYAQYAWSTGAATASIAIPGTGRYYVTVTDTNGCTGSDTVIAGSSNNINVAATTTNATCTYSADGSISLTIPGGGYTYQWSNGATGSTISGLAPGIYTCTIRNTATGCTYQRTFTVGAKADLSVRESIVNTSDSEKADGAIQVKGVGGSGNYTYLWNTGAFTPSLSNISAGIYYLKITDATYGCNLFDTITVDDGNNPLAVTISTTASSACNTANGTATANVTGGSGSYIYLWSNGATTATISGLAAGTYYVSVYDNVKKYRKSASVTITNTASLTVAGTVAASSCTSFTGAISLAVSGGSGNYSYSWSNGSVTANLTGLQEGVYIVRVTDNVNGCIAQKVFTVNQAGGPSATLNVTQPLCDNNAGGSITAVAAGSSNRYLWSTGATTASISGLTPGTYSLMIRDTATGCASPYSATLLPREQLTVKAIQHTNTACPSSPNGSIALTVTGGIAPYTYAWSTGAATPAITGLAAGLYLVKVMDNNGCSDSLRTTITDDTSKVLHAIVVSTAPASCYTTANGSAHITASGGTPPYTYSWSTGAATADLSNVVPGLYTLSVHDAAGCTVSVNVAIASDTMNSVRITVDSVSNTSCTGSNSGKIYTHADRGTSPYTYLWSSGATTASVTGLATGSYSVVVTDAGGCKDTATASIARDTTLNINLDVTGIKCTGDANGAITVNITGGSGQYSYAWSNGGNTSNITNLAAGNYSVSVTDNTTQCSGTGTATLTQPPVLLAQTAITNESCTGTNNGSANITVTGGTAPYTYIWMGSGISNIVNNLTKGDYNATVTDAGGCSITLTAHIGNNCDTSNNGNGNGNGNGDVNIHNVITPNGDGANDYFVIEGILLYPDASVQIFDKWGDVVYAQDHYRNTWAGTDKSGNPLASGTYYYVLKLNAMNINGGNNSFTGFIMVQH